MDWVETLPKPELPVVTVPSVVVLDQGVKGLSVSVVFPANDYDNGSLF